MVRLAILMMMLSILSCKKKDKDSETSIVDEVNPEVIEEELERSSATGSGPESASLEIDSDSDGLADIAYQASSTKLTNQVHMTAAVQMIFSFYHLCHLWS